jgi:hypothetical protein
MSEDTTRQLPSSAEDRIMSAIAEMRAEMNERFAAVENEIAATRRAFNTRISSLEEQAAERSRETRPIWEELLMRVKKMDGKLGVLALDLLDQRAEINDLKNHLPPAA